MAATGKRYKAEQIVNKLREVDVMTANGKTIPEACKSIAISEQTYYRWRKIYGGLKVDQAKKFKELEAENARLKKLVAEISLREAMLKEVVRGKLLSPARRKAAAQMLIERFHTSERKACVLVGLSRTVWRYHPQERNDDAKTLSMSGTKMTAVQLQFM